MGSILSRKKSHEVINRQGWDVIIESVTRQLQEYEKEAGRLRVLIEYFTSRKASGDPFPGEDRLRERGLL